MGEKSLQHSSIKRPIMLTRKAHMANFYWKMLTTQSKWKAIWRDIRAHRGHWPVGITTRDHWYKLAVAMYRTREAGQ
jgi:hypothetical protein